MARKGKWWSSNGILKKGLWYRIWEGSKLGFCLTWRGDGVWEFGNKEQYWSEGEGKGDGWMGLGSWEIFKFN